MAVLTKLAQEDPGNLNWRSSIVDLLKLLKLTLRVTGSVKMIRFSYSNKDTKDEEEEEGWSARHDPYTGCGAKRLVLYHTIGPVAEPRRNTACPVCLACESSYPIRGQRVLTISVL
jgi:hypothetical protein